MKAIEFLEQGEEKRWWDNVTTYHHHPYYESGLYNGNDKILTAAIKIAYLEGKKDAFIEAGPYSDLVARMDAELSQYFKTDKNG